jgi:DNA polymerase III epsilon subunit family exonuclease
MIKTFFSKILQNKSEISTYINDPLVVYVRKLLSQNNINKCLNYKLEDITFAVIDTETTGLNKKEDKILSIAAVKIKKIKIVDIYNVFVDAGITIPEESKKFHGIDNEHLKDKPKLIEIFPDFLKFLKNTIIVGHHIRFDVGMINIELEKIYGAKLPNYTIDTGQLYNFLTDTEEKASLDYLMKEFHVKCEDRHSALGDAIATAEVFIKIISKFGNKIRLLDDLYQNKLLKRI